MDYRDALNYILSFTDFERLPGFAYAAANFDLRRMAQLLDGLGNPQAAPRSIHIAGTKGKGSTAAMIASALSVAGYRVGLYISPHLHTFRERISMGGGMIAEAEFAAMTQRVKPLVDEANRRREYGELTTFEILTAIAFAFFAQRGVDFQVLETGLGGRLDATNVVSPEVCVITSISLDHAEVLGDSLTDIAREKAGIIKPGAVVVCAPQAAEAGRVILEVCSEKDVRPVVVGRDVTWSRMAADLSGQTLEVTGTVDAYRLTIPLLGAHQLENAATAVAALEALGVGSGSIDAGLARVRWPGRLEILRREPLLLADGAHNAESARRLKEAIAEYTSYDRMILIIGASSDKDVAGMIGELAPLAHAVLATRSRHPRAMGPGPLTLAMSSKLVEGIRTDSVSEAVERALDMAGPDDLICATGSLFVAAEVREHVLGIPAEII